MIITAIFFGAVGLFGLVFFLVIVKSTLDDARARSAARPQSALAPTGTVLLPDRAGRFTHEPQRSRQAATR